MALIHVFSNFTEEKKTYNFNGKIRDNITDVDWNNAVLLRGGFRITADYEAKENDIIFLRKTPAAATAVGLVFATVALIAGAIDVGVKAYNNKIELEKLEKAQQAAKNGTAENSLPFVRGARNQAATGQTFPYIIGETYYTPLRLASPYYTIDGNVGQNQYYNIILETGYNNLFIKKLKLGETTIKTFSGSTPQNGVYNWDAGTYYDEKNIIEIRQSGEFTTAGFNDVKKCIELNKEIPHRYLSPDASDQTRQEINTEWTNGVVQQLPTHAKDAEIIVLFDGLRKYDTEKGTWTSKKVTLKPQWSNNADSANPTWNDFDNAFQQGGYKSNTFRGLTAKQMRYVARQTFTPAQALNKNISIRVIRTTEKEESSANDTVYLMAVQSTIYDAKKSSSSGLVTAKILEDRERAQCTRIGVRIAANTNTTGLLDAISVEVAAQAQTWNGSAWSTAKTATRNLAAWTREILLSDKHAPSQYTPEELDESSWGAWFNYCETMGFHADGALTKSATKESIINTLLANGNAALFYNPMTGKIEISIDNGRGYSVALLNSDTIQSISTAKEFKRRTDGKKVTYINRAEGYDIDSVIFMRDGGAYDPATDTLTTSALEYITDYAHAFKYAWRQMAEEIAQPRTATVKVGHEAAYYPLFSRVEVQHKTFKNGISHARIKSLTWHNNLLLNIKLENPVTFPAGTQCGLIINCNTASGRGILPVKVSGTGKTDTLQVITTVSRTDTLQPSAGDFCSFGELDTAGDFSTITRSMKIINVEESDNGYTLTLVDYNPDLYTYGTLPEYKSNITLKPTIVPPTIASQRDTITAGEAQANAAEAAQAAVDTIGGTRFTNIYKLRPLDMTLEEIVAKMDSDNKNTSASISISEDEILLRVDDMASELTALIDIQAGSIQALVEGGGAAGEMSLSLNLPVLITPQARARLIAASSEDKVNAVYGKINDNYGIKGNVSNADIKALWDDAVAAKMLASQIELQADQIFLNGDVIVNENKKIKAAAIDVDEIKGTSGFFDNITARGATLTKVTASGIFGETEETTLDSNAAYSFNIGPLNFKTLHLYVFSEDTYTYKTAYGQVREFGMWRYIAEFVINAGEQYIAYYDRNFPKIRSLNIIYKDTTIVSDLRKYENIGDVLIITLDSAYANKKIKITTLQIA